MTCYSLFWEGAKNAAGKEPHEGSGQPVKADGHRLLYNKNQSLKKDLQKLHNTKDL